MTPFEMGVVVGWGFYVAAQLTSLVNLVREIRNNLRHQVNLVAEAEKVEREG